MGLDVAGLHGEARAAYRWLTQTQRSDGAWPAAIVEDDRFTDGILDPTLDANFCAYVATGLWHHYLITGDVEMLRAMWPVIDAAIGFVLDLQMRDGAISWARDADYVPADHALLTSSSSIYGSLRWAVAIATELEEIRPDWELSLASLGDAIRSESPDFAPKDRFAMDWYYPVLGGAMVGGTAVERLLDGWDTFVVEGKGVLCTSDKPWVTTGETCELAIACAISGLDDRAEALLDWVEHLRDSDGLYWTGKNHPDGSLWPYEKTSWSAASVILATDCLDRGSPTRALFTPDPGLVPTHPAVEASKSS